MSELKSRMLLAVEHAERMIDNANYQRGFFANSYASLFDKVKREAPHLISHADERANLFARYSMSGNRVDVNLVVDSEAAEPVQVAFPDENIVEFPRIARLPGAEI